MRSDTWGRPSIGIHLRIPLDYVALAQLGTAERASAAAVEAHGIWIYNSPVYPDPLRPLDGRHRTLRRRQGAEPVHGLTQQPELAS